MNTTQLAAEAAAQIQPQCSSRCDSLETKTRIIQTAIEKAVAEGREQAFHECRAALGMISGERLESRAAHASERICITCGKPKDPNWTGECLECEQKAIRKFDSEMIHIKQGKQPRKRRLPLRLLTVDQLIKKAQQGSDAARRELQKRLRK